MLKLFSRNETWLSNDSELMTNQPNCSKALFEPDLAEQSITTIYNSIGTIKGNFDYYIELHNFAIRMCQFVFDDKRFTDLNDNYVKTQVIKSLFLFVKFINEYKIKRVTFLLFGRPALKTIIIFL